MKKEIVQDYKINNNCLHIYFKKGIFNNYWVLFLQLYDTYFLQHFQDCAFGRAIRSTRSRSLQRSSH